MDERRANIDLVFRNGLKDYEVLPPTEVWNNIRPVVRKKQRPLIFLRYAAAVAVISSLGYLAYMWSLQVNPGLENNDIAQAELPGSPVIDAAIDQIPGTVTSVREDRPAGSVSGKPVPDAAFIPSIPAESVSFPEDDRTTLLNVIYQPATPEIMLNDREALLPGLRLLINTKDDKVSIESLDLLSSPVIQVKDKTERWTIAALVSPSYYTNFYAGNDEMTTQLVSDEQPVFSYSGGLALSYKINSRVSVQSGLYYSSLGHEISGITSFGGFQPYDYTKGDRNFELRTTNGLIYTNNADVFLLDSRSDDRIITRYTRDYFDPAKANLEYIDNSLRQNFSYLELPFIVRYKLIDKTVDLNIVGGLSSNILVNNSVFASSDGGRYQVGKTEGMSLLTFSSALGMGMEYNLTGNLSLNLEPTLRYYLNPFSQLPGMKVHPYSFGIFSGISYRF